MRKVKREQAAPFHINGLNQNCKQAKHYQKTVKTSQPSLNILPVFIITEQTVLVQSIYVKQASLLSLHLARTLDGYTESKMARFCDLVGVGIGPL